MAANPNVFIFNKYVNVSMQTPNLNASLLIGIIYNLAALSDKLKLRLSVLPQFLLDLI